MIIDGNCYQFLASLIDQEEKGDLEAANRLTEILKGKYPGMGLGYFVTIFLDTKQ